MAIDFPASPTNGQTFTSGSVTYTYDGTKWTALASGGGATDKIEEGNTSAEVIDTGSDGRFVVTTEGSERLRCDSSGRLLVGTSSARSNLYANTAAYTSKIQFESNTNTWGNGLSLLNYSGSGYGPVLALGLSFSNTQGTNTLVQAGEICGKVQFLANDGTNFLPIAEIQGYTDAATSTNDVPGRLVFSTAADGASSPTERMRIANNGFISFAGDTDTGLSVPASNVLAFTTGGSERGRFDASGYFSVGTSTATLASVNFKSNTAAITTLSLYDSSGDNTSRNIQAFFRNGEGAGNIVGTISTTNTATAYNTSSDYRLKENVVPLTGAVDRLSQLKVHRFNFIVDPDKTVDGFLAHEAQAVVPECVTGEKDAVDDEGNHIYQGIDQSKLVPLLTAALQEALAKIETMEARLTAAGI